MVGPVEHNPTLNDRVSGFMNRPRGASNQNNIGKYALVALFVGGIATLVNSYFGSPNDEDIYSLVPVAEEAVQFDIGEDANDMKGMVVILPGGTMITPVGFEALREGVRVCVNKPVHADQGSNLVEPKQFVTKKCAAQAVVPHSSTDSSTVPLPGRGITLHVVTVPADEGVTSVSVRGTIDVGATKTT